MGAGCEPWLQLIAGHGNANRTRHQRFAHTTKTTGRCRHSGSRAGQGRRRLGARANLHGAEGTHAQHRAGAMPSAIRGHKRAAHTHGATHTDAPCTSRSTTLHTKAFADRPPADTVRAAWTTGGISSPSALFNARARSKKCGGAHTLRRSVASSFWGNVSWLSSAPPGCTPNEATAGVATPSMAMRLRSVGSGEPACASRHLANMAVASFSRRRQRITCTFAVVAQPHGGTQPTQSVRAGKRRRYRL